MMVTRKLNSVITVLYLLVVTNITAQTIIFDKLTSKEQVAFLVQESNATLKENLFLSDSLIREGLKLAEKINDPQALIDLLITKGRLLNYQFELEQSIVLLEECMNLLGSQDSSLEERIKIHLILADTYIKQVNLKMADNHINQTEMLLGGSTNIRMRNRLLLVRGHFYYVKRDYNNARKQFELFLENVEQMEDEEMKVEGVIHMAQLKQKIGEFSSALKLLISIKDNKYTNLTKTNYQSVLGRIYESIEDWEKAKNWLKKAIDLQKKIGVKAGVANDLYSLGVIYKRQNNFGEALKLFEETLAIKEKQNAYPGDLLGSIANIYNQLGDQEKAEQYFELYLAKATERDDWGGICGIYYNKGYYLFTQNNIIEAQTNFQKCYEIGRERVNPRFLMIIHEMLAKTHISLNQNEKAIFHQSEYERLDKEIFSNSKLRELGGLENNVNGIVETPIPTKVSKRWSEIHASTLLVICFNPCDSVFFSTE